jgi:cyclic pyranopterin phosphate synthase
MPRDRFGEHHTFLPLRAQLSFEEIEMFVRACLPLGLTKARITGGEPLLRPGVPALVQRLSALGVEIALTTNASLLKEQAPLLAESGLDRVTVSLDALDPQTHASMVDSAIPVETVLEGIEAALENDLGPVKVNCVVQRGINESEVPALVRHFRGTGVIVRFIEYMDVGRTNGWSPGQVVPSNNLLRDLRKEFDLVPAEQASTSDVATMWTHSDGSGEVGFISSVSKPFCGECVRARLSADGHLFTCLFASGGHDLRAIIHGGGEIGDLTDAIAAVWSRRTDRYSEMRSLETSSLPRIEMSYIGG